MPLYEYQCAQCGQVSEFLVRRVGDTPERSEMVCVHCGGKDLRRLLSRVLCRSGRGSVSCPTGMCPLSHNEHN